MGGAEILVSIRRANLDDNQALLDLEKMCPQGTGLVLLFDRSPDFFRRSQVYDNYTIYVAEEERKIVGTIGSATKEFSLHGEKVNGVYIYDLRVHPNYRGRGIGSDLIQQVVAEADRSDLAYGVIMEENYPSIALFKKMGFRNIHDFTLFNVPLYQRQKRVTCNVRSMTEDDVPHIVNLINSYYRNHDFFSSLNTTDFRNKVKQLPGYGFQKIQVAEVENRTVACAGLWDYSEIFRISALRVSAKLRLLSYLLRFINVFKKTVRLPSVREAFRLMYVRDFAFTEESDAVKDLIEHCLCLAYGYGCNFLSFVLDPNDPAVPLVAKYKPIRVTNHVYAKSLTDKLSISSTMMYVDPADL